MNINFSTIDLKKVLVDGIKVQQNKHAKEDKKKLGNLRGGSTGCVTEDGKICGTCHRVHMARALGYQLSPDIKSVYHFLQGQAMEDKVTEILKKGWEGKVYTEEEVATNWQTKNGTKVSGRPDILLEGSESVGIEVKTVCSTSTAEAIYWKDQPKLMHLIQSTHYMMERKVPFILMYNNFNSLDTTFWTKKAKENLLPNGKINYKLKTPPFSRMYKLALIDGTVYYYSQQDNTKHKTIITEKGVRDYFEVVADMIEEKELGPKISSIDSVGKELPYDLCNYCDFKEPCSETGDYELWLDLVKQLVKEAEWK